MELKCQMSGPLLLSFFGFDFNLWPFVPQVWIGQWQQCLGGVRLPVWTIGFVLRKTLRVILLTLSKEVFSYCFKKANNPAVWTASHQLLGQRKVLRFVFLPFEDGRSSYATNINIMLLIICFLVCGGFVWWYNRGDRTCQIQQITVDETIEKWPNSLDAPKTKPPCRIRSVKWPENHTWLSRTALRSLGFVRKTQW